METGDISAAKGPGILAQQTARLVDQAGRTLPALNLLRFSAQVRVGDAAASGGLWEYAVNSVVGQRSWGTSATGHLDTGPVDVELAVEATASDSGAVWSVSDASPLSHRSTTSYASIQKVGVRAEVVSHPNDPVIDPTHNYRSEWVSLAVTFLDGAGGSYVINAGSTSHPLPIATFAESPLGSLRAFAVNGVTTVFEPPSGFNAVHAVVAGVVRLRSLNDDRKAPPSLGANQVTAKVFVWTS